MKEQDIYDTWTEFITSSKYKKYFKSNIKQVKDMTKPILVKEERKKQDNDRNIVKAYSELSILHKKYKTMNSNNLHNHFTETPSDWEEYHKISKVNEESFPEEEIPRNKMSKYLETLSGTKSKIIADLGCGYAEICKKFKNNTRFKFYNFDHVSSDKNIEARDIRDTGLDDYSVDIVILSLAMWGSNCKEYIKEAYRILDIGGTLLISEPYKRWNDNDEKENKLIILLESNEFKIINNEENKFMFIECRK